MFDMVKMIDNVCNMVKMVYNVCNIFLNVPECFKTQKNAWQSCRKLFNSGLCENVISVEPGLLSLILEQFKTQYMIK